MRNSHYTEKQIAFALRQYSRYNRDLYFDEVEYRNSKVQKVFIDSKIRTIPALTIENHVRFERNKQIEGTMYDNTFQPDDIVSTLAMVNKFVYTKQWGSWTFSPGVKFRLYKKGRSESLNPLDHYMMRIPFVYLKYTISPKRMLLSVCRVSRVLNYSSVITSRAIITTNRLTIHSRLKTGRIISVSIYGAVLDLN